MIIVSACLAGHKCRYDGKAMPNNAVMELVRSGQAVPVCPECLGGLTTPRPSAEIIGGSGEDVLTGKAKVLAKNGDSFSDVTAAFVSGAYAALEKAKNCGADEAILKSSSPSCGCGTIYNGNFNGTKRSGNGVAAALFIQNGIRVRSV